MLLGTSDSACPPALSAAHRAKRSRSRRRHERLWLLEPDTGSHAVPTIGDTCANTNAGVGRAFATDVLVARTRDLTAATASNATSPSTRMRRLGRPARRHAVSRPRTTDSSVWHAADGSRLRLGGVAVRVPRAPGCRVRSQHRRAIILSVETLGRIMWIEAKVDGLSGPARIGRVTPARGRGVRYGDKRFQTLRGSGFKANYYDVETGDEYWISGCHKDGRDALYSTTVEIDEDVREEYWRTIRGRPDLVHVHSFRAEGKYRR